MKNNLRVYFALLAAMFFWGMSFIWYKSAYESFEPMTVIFFRLLISFPLLILFSLLVKRLRWPRKKDLKYFLLLAFFEPFLYFLGESHGMKHISATLGAIIISTIPIFTPITAYYFFREKFTVNNYLGMLISFIGVLLVIYVESSAGESSLKGILLMMLGVMSTQGYTLLLKKLSRRYSALSIVSIQNLLGTLYFLPLFLLTEAGSFSWKEYVPADFLPVIYMAIFASSLAFILFVEGVKKIGITRATVFTNFVPIITAIFSIFFAGEEMTFLKAGGIFVMVSGLFMSQATGVKKIRIYSRVKE